MQIESGVVVTPEKAAAWLAKSEGNRLIRAWKVAGFKSDMEAGRWKQNGETLKFLEDGTLKDGHHRLLACMQAGIEFTAAVAVISPDACSTIDKGTPRSVADNLVFELNIGPHDAGVITTAVRIMTIHDNTSLADWAKPANNEYTGRWFTQAAIDDYVLEHLDEINAGLAWLNDNLKRQDSLLSKGQALAVIVLAARLYGFEAVTDFVRKVLTGYGIEPGTTEDHLRGALMAVKMRQRKMTSAQKAYSMVKCLRSVMAGRGIKHAGNAVYRPSGDAIPNLRQPKGNDDAAGN